MELVSIDQKTKCFHCGDECDSASLHFDQKEFCCQGCVSVYEIIQDSNLTAYYELESFPGFRQSIDQHKFAYLDNPKVEHKLLDFASEGLQKVRLSIPAIHCSSCIWLLENLRRLHRGVLSSRADLSERELALDYDPRVISLRKLVDLLASIGYEPSISLDQRNDRNFRNTKRGLILKIAVAGFCFGNIMLLSFPEYLGMEFGSDQQLTWWFSRLMILLSLPVLFYCASDYFRSASKGIKQKYLNIDVPIVLGITALAGWSYYEILFELGPGYLDSLAGLLFLLLIGKWFQNQTYSNLSFNRDFKSYFPLAVSKITNNHVASVLVEELKTGDVILVRNKELIPADSELLDDRTSIDYSFVSGESQEVLKSKGDHIFAGGRHIGLKTRYKILKPVSQSYLTQLWNHEAFRKSKQDSRDLLINSISKYFTSVVLLIALASAAYWATIDIGKSVFVFTSVLIVACPCALAMATPFTLGNVMKVLGKNKLYLKNSQVVDRIAEIKTLIFDKTGTLSRHSDNLNFSSKLNKNQAHLLYALTGQSNHPVSQEIHTYLKNHFSLNGEELPVLDFVEQTGAGISARINNQFVQLGNPRFTGHLEELKIPGTHLVINDEMLGSFHREPDFRSGLTELISNLSAKFKIILLSGDHEGDRSQISQLFPSFHSLHFRQTPMEKLEFVENLQKQGEKIMMLGDGLNDAGALQKSNVGLAVTEHPHHFTPASDGILHASSMTKLWSIIQLTQWAQMILKLSFGLSFIYNLVGITLAVTGNLTPIAAAILMPLSSISVVYFPRWL